MGFEYTERLQAMTKELAAIDAELDLSKQEISAMVIDDEQFKDEVIPIEHEEIEFSENEY